MQTGSSMLRSRGLKRIEKAIITMHRYQRFATEIFLKNILQFIDNLIQTNALIKSIYHCRCLTNV
jgi:hypothetical protein